MLLVGMQSRASFFRFVRMHGHKMRFSFLKRVEVGGQEYGV